MMNESKTRNDGEGDGRFERWARARPVSFTAMLVMLTMFVTVALLFQKSYSFVLYQGF
jgi:hypothetical protein